MPLAEGEMYRCPDPRCGGEVTVTKGAAPGRGSAGSPAYCRGHVMEKAR